MPGEAEVHLRERLSRLRSLPLLRGARLSGELERLQRQLDRMSPSRLTRRSGARSSSPGIRTGRTRSTTSSGMLDDFVELHGDRGRADDEALVTGLGSFDGRTVALIGHQKGRDIQERTKRNFGMAYPEGYRKAMRVMELADRHGFPADHARRHPGGLPRRRRRAARPGRGDRPLTGGDGAADVPIVACVIGEGGSGGAIAIARRRPGADAGERDLLGHLAGGLRGDPLARRRRGAEGRRRLQARRGPLPRARCRSTRSFPSPRAVRTPIPTRRRGC